MGEEESRCSNKRTPQGIIVEMKLFSFLILVRVIRIYTCYKIAQNQKAYTFTNEYIQDE